MQNINTYVYSIIVLVLTIVFVRVFHVVYFKFLKNQVKSVNLNPTTYNFLGHFIKAIIFIVGFSLAIIHIPQLKNIATSLLAGAGIAAVAIGFASQKALSNIVSGIFIIIFKPFKIGDRLNIKSTLTGMVEDITLRHTVIRDFENKRIIIPNSVISDEVLINFDLSDLKMCKHLEIGISYNSNIDKAKSIIREEIINHPFYIDNRQPEDIENGLPDVTIRVIGLLDSAVNIRAWVWAANSNESFTMHCDLLESIKKRFDAEGIEIPFPHRTVYMRKDN